MLMTAQWIRYCLPGAPETAVLCPRGRAHKCRRRVRFDVLKQRGMLMTGSDKDKDDDNDNSKNRRYSEKRMYRDQLLVSDTSPYVARCRQHYGPIPARQPAPQPLKNPDGTYNFVDFDPYLTVSIVDHFQRPLEEGWWASCESELDVEERVRQEAERASVAALGVQP